MAYKIGQIVRGKVWAGSDYGFQTPASFKLLKEQGAFKIGAKQLNRIGQALAKAYEKYVPEQIKGAASAYGKKLAESQQKQAQIEQSIIEQGGVGSLVYKARQEAAQRRGQDIKSLSDRTNVDPRLLEGGLTVAETLAEGKVGIDSLKPFIKGGKAALRSPGPVPTRQSRGQGTNRIRTRLAQRQVPKAEAGSIGPDDGGLDDLLPKANADPPRLAARKREEQRQREVLQRVDKRLAGKEFGSKAYEDELRKILPTLNEKDRDLVMSGYKATRAGLNSTEMFTLDLVEDSRQKTIHQIVDEAGGYRPFGNAEDLDDALSGRSGVHARRVLEGKQKRPEQRSIGRTPFSVNAGVVKMVPDSRYKGGAKPTIRSKVQRERAKRFAELSQDSASRSAELRGDQWTGGKRPALPITVEGRRPKLITEDKLNRIRRALLDKDDLVQLGNDRDAGLFGNKLDGFNPQGAAKKPGFLMVRDDPQKTSMGRTRSTQSDFTGRHDDSLFNIDKPGPLSKEQMELRKQLNDFYDDHLKREKSNTERQLFRSRYSGSKEDIEQALMFTAFKKKFPDAEELAEKDWSAYYDKFTEWSKGLSPDEQAKILSVEVTPSRQNSVSVNRRRIKRLIERRKGRRIGDPPIEKPKLETSEQKAIRERADEYRKVQSDRKAETDKFWEDYEEERRRSRSARIAKDSAEEDNLERVAERNAQVVAQKDGAKLRKDLSVMDKTLPGSDQITKKDIATLKRVELWSLDNIPDYKGTFTREQLENLTPDMARRLKAEETIKEWVFNNKLNRGKIDKGWVDVESFEGRPTRERKKAFEEREAIATNVSEWLRQPQNKAWFDRRVEKAINAPDSPIRWSPRPFGKGHKRVSVDEALEQFGSKIDELKDRLKRSKKGSPLTPGEQKARKGAVNDGSANDDWRPRFDGDKRVPGDEQRSQMAFERDLTIDQNYDTKTSKFKRKRRRNDGGGRQAKGEEFRDGRFKQTEPVSQAKAKAKEIKNRLRTERYEEVYDQQYPDVKTTDERNELFRADYGTRVDENRVAPGSRLRTDNAAGKESVRSQFRDARERRGRRPMKGDTRNRDNRRALKDQQVERLKDRLRKNRDKFGRYVEEPSAEDAQIQSEKKLKKVYEGQVRGEGRGVNMVMGGRSAVGLSMRNQATGVQGPRRNVIAKPDTRQRTVPYGNTILDGEVRKKLEEAGLSEQVKMFQREAAKLREKRLPKAKQQRILRKLNKIKEQLKERYDERKFKVMGRQIRR